MCSCGGEKRADPGLQRRQRRERRSAEGEELLEVLDPEPTRRFPPLKMNHLVSMVTGPEQPEGQDGGGAVCGGGRTCVDQRHQIPAVGESSSTLLLRVEPDGITAAA